MADVINLAFQISADLKGVQTQLKTMEGNFQQSFGKIQGLAANAGREILGALGIGLGVGAFIGFVKSSLTGVAALQDLSDQSGITATNLAVLKLAGVAAGQGIEESVAAVIKLQRTLIESRSQGTEPTNKGLRALGLSARELADALTDPNKLLEIIPQKLANMSNQAQRNAVAMDIAGRSGFKLAATFLDLAANQEKYRASVNLTNEQIRDLDAQLDKSAQAWEVLKFHIAGAAVELAKWAGLLKFTETDKLNSALQANSAAVVKLRRELDAARETAQGSSPFKFEQQIIDKAKASIPVLEKQLAMQMKVREMIEKDITKQDVKPKLAPPPGPTDDAALKRQQSFIDGLKKQAVQLGINNTELLRGKDITAELNAEFAAAGGNVENPTFVKWRDQVVALNAELSRTKLFIEQMGAGIDQSDMDFGKAKADEIAGQMADVVRLRKQIDDAARARQEIVAPDEDPGSIFANARISLDGLNDSMNRQSEIEFELSEQMKNIDAQAVAFGDSFDAAAARVEALRTAIQSLIGAGLEPLGPNLKEKSDQLRQFEDSTKIANTAESLIRGGAQGISDSLRSVALGTQTLGEAWGNMGLAAVAAIQNVILEMLILEPLIKSMRAAMNSGGSSGSSSGGLFGAIGGFIGGLFKSFDDGGVVGGPIGAPRLAKVHGGETILPTHKSGGGFGGSSNVYNIDARGAQRGVSEEIKRAIEMSRQSAVRESVGAVADERSRSNLYARRFSR